MNTNFWNTERNPLTNIVFALAAAAFIVLYMSFVVQCVDHQDIGFDIGWLFGDLARRADGLDYSGYGVFCFSIGLILMGIGFYIVPYVFGMAFIHLLRVVVMTIKVAVVTAYRVSCYCLNKVIDLIEWMDGVQF